MTNYLIEYKLNKRSLKLKEINSLYKIIEINYKEIKLSTKLIQIFLNKSIQILQQLKQTNNNNNNLDDSSLNNNNNNEFHRSSPVSVIYISEDSHLVEQLYSKKVINILRELFFTCDESEFDNYYEYNNQNQLQLQLQLQNQQKQSPLLISIEGNIGAGKTTLLNKLKEIHPEWVFIDEPVDFWTALMSNNGESLFELYYHNQHRWAYTFQNCAVLSRYHAIESTLKQQQQQHHHQSKENNSRQVYITERCLQSDFQIFAKKLYLEGKMDNIEFELYQKWFQQLIGTSNIELSGVILVDTLPETCYERIKGRGRDGEEGIPLKYLEELNYYQEEWLSTLSTRTENKNVPCYRTTSIEDIEKFVNQLLISH